MLGGVKVPGLPLSMGDWVDMCSPKPFSLVFALCRMIQNSFVDMENMFELFHEEQEVGATFPGPCSLAGPVVLPWDWLALSLSLCFNR